MQDEKDRHFQLNTKLFKREIVSIVILTGLNIFDAVSTVIGINVGLNEFNNLAKLIGMPVFLSLKVIAMPIGAYCFIYYFDKKNHRDLRAKFLIGIWFTSIFFALIILNNTILILDSI